MTTNNKTRQRWAAALTAGCGIILAGLNAPLAANAATTTAENPVANWGFKTSFNKYVQNPMFNGKINTSDEVKIESPANFKWSVGEGTVDTEAKTANINFKGNIHWQSHPMGDKYALDINMSNIRIKINKSKAMLSVDIKSRKFAGMTSISNDFIENTDVLLATSDETQMTKTGDNTYEFSAKSTKLTEAGAKAFGSFYSKDEEINGFDLTLKAMPSDEKTTENKDGKDGKAAKPAKNFSIKAKEVNRAGGKDRIETSVALWEKTDKESVVLAGYNGVADAFASGPLAASLDTSAVYQKGDTLNPKVLEAIKNKTLKEAVIVGGEGVVSKATQNQLEKLGVKVTRLAGKDRYATAVEMAKYLVKTNKLDLKTLPIVIATGTNFADSLVSGPIAHKLKGVTLMTKGATLTPETAQFLKESEGKIIAVGGPAQAAIKANPTLAKRLEQSYVGKDRYNTSLLVAKNIFANTTLYGLVNGMAAADGAVAGGYLGEKEAPVILTKADQLPEEIAKSLNKNSKVLLVGGETVLTTALAKGIK